MPEKQKSPSLADELLQNIVRTVSSSKNTMMNQLSLIQSQTLGFDDWITESIIESVETRKGNILEAV